MYGTARTTAYGYSIWEVSIVAGVPASSSSSASSVAAIQVEAENYFAMSGVQTETTSDTGGGSDVGWIDANDWMGYNVTIPAAGTYTVSYRVATPNNGCVLQLESYGGVTVYGTVNIPNTGGWQTWTTVSQTVTFPVGNLQLAVKANTGGWNINWLKLTRQ